MDMLTIILSIGIPSLSAMAAYLVKNLLHRLDNLETQLQSKTSDVEVRQLLTDKLEPINKALDEIKNQNDKLYDLYIKLVSK